MLRRCKANWKWSLLKRNNSFTSLIYLKQNGQKILCLQLLQFNQDQSNLAKQKYLTVFTQLLNIQAKMQHFHQSRRKTSLLLTAVLPIKPDCLKFPVILLPPQQPPPRPAMRIINLGYLPCAKYPEWSLEIRSCKNAPEPHVTGTVWRWERGGLFPYRSPQRQDNPVKSDSSFLIAPVSRNKAGLWVYNLLCLLNNHPELLTQGMRSAAAIWFNLGTLLLISSRNSCLETRTLLFLTQPKQKNLCHLKAGKSSRLPAAEPGL